MKRDIVLASQSPRRKELMQMADLPFRVVLPEGEEVLNTEVSIGEAIEQIAKQKAVSVFNKEPEAVVVSADTVVYLENEVLGKPKTDDKAVQMLKKLSGKTHQVITGVCIMSKEETVTFHSVANVKFYDLSEEDIQHYVATGEPLDKAGAYGIQGKGCVLVESIEGDYYTIVGLPIAAVAKVLKKYV